MRGTAAVIGGLALWMVIATLGNLVLRNSWPDYASVEKAMTFTPAMLFARLALGVLASLGAGLLVAWIAARGRVALACLIGLLLVLFVPLHYSLWDRFPAWYHAVFLLSLIGVPLLAAMVPPKRTV